MQTSLPHPTLSLHQKLPRDNVPHAGQRMRFLRFGSWSFLLLKTIQFHRHRGYGLAKLSMLINFSISSPQVRGINCLMRPCPCVTSTTRLRHLDRESVRILLIISQGVELFTKTSHIRTGYKYKADGRWTSFYSEVQVFILEERAPPSLIPCSSVYPRWGFDCAKAKPTSLALSCHLCVCDVLVLGGTYPFPPISQRDLEESYFQR